MRCVFLRVVILFRYAKHKLTFIALTFFTAGCTTTLTDFPDVKYDEWTLSVLVATPKSGRYLNDFEECLNGACMDFPPVAIKYIVHDNIYGEIFPPSIEVATTSHTGLLDFDFEKSKPELILILSEGDKKVLPRNHRTSLAKLKTEDYAVPIYAGRELWWFPCSISEEIKPANFDHLAADLGVPSEEGYDYDPELLKYVSLQNGLFVPKYAIRVEGIRQYLSSNTLLFKQFRCKK